MFFTTVVLAVGVLVSCVLCADTQDEENTLGSMHFDGSGSNSSPPSLLLNLAIGGENLDLKLDLAPDLDQDVAVYLIDSNAEQFSLNRTTTQSKFNIYQDRERGAVFMLVNETDDSGNSTHVLEGLVNKDGEVYHMHTEVSSNSLGSSTGPSSRRASSPIQLQFQKKKIQFSGVYDAGVRVEPPTSGEETVTPGEATSRHKRQVTQDVYVDVVAMADYAVYSLWYSRSTQTTTSAKRQDALNKIKQYYALLFKSVDMIFQSLTTLNYAIHIRLVGIVIAETPSSSPMTENLQRVDSPRYTVDTNSALTSLKDWVNQKTSFKDGVNQLTLPSHDHFMLFTGYDLTSGFSKSSIGNAYVGTVCDSDGSETSLVEDTGTFEAVLYAARVLGYGFSVNQDGDGNFCRGSDNYVMSPSITLAANVINMWKFSTCSATYFNTYISNMAPSLRESCMYNRITVSSDIPDVTSQMPGQVYNPIQQCRANYGSNFYFSQAVLLTNKGGYNYLCEYMPCMDGTESRVYFALAAQGTTCGDKMWCINGRCVYDSAAPSARSDCLFGDQAGKLFSDAFNTCADFVSKKYVCYQELARQACCDTCAKLKRHVSNCEYGNNATGCSAASCSSYDSASKQLCCETCNIGTPYTPPPAIDGQWGSWASWSSCSVTCGGGQQTRTRLCNNPAPQNGGYFCRSGSNTDVTVCVNQPCPIDGQWGSWGSWSSCSVTCGGGQQNRARVCDNPPPQYGGSNCMFGSSGDTTTCNTNPCPIDGQWGLWGTWASCGVTCGNGTQTKTRFCDSPAPQYGGSFCQSGSNADVTFCSTNITCLAGKAGSLGGERTLILVAIVAVGLLLHLDDLP